MNTSMQINLSDILLCLSKAQTIVSPIIGKHQMQVAYLAYRLSEQLKMPTRLRKDIYLAGLVHDIGALSLQEKLDIIENEPVDINTHARRGARLLESFKPLAGTTELIRYHHVPWAYGAGATFEGNAVPPGSHILHLADRVCVRFTSRRSVISQLPAVMQKIQSQKGAQFVPEYVEALDALCEKEAIWLDIMSDDPVSKLPAWLAQVVPLTLQDMIDLSKLLSHIIDFSSKFTSRHSSGVAKIAERLAQLAGLSPKECKEMLVAGYLHDIGKLAIDSNVLEKPSALNDEEFNEMRSHTYYTYYLLNDIPEFHTIKLWAAYHHERVNGTGYPFHIDGDALSLGSRIMAVADVFTAITEDRPYRSGMDDARATKILKDMAENGSLDKRLTALLLDHFQEMNTLRDFSQKEASEMFRHFFDGDGALPAGNKDIG